MDEELGQPKDLKVELRRLRNAFRQLLALEVGDPALPLKLANLKSTVSEALAQVTLIRCGENGAQLDMIREKAAQSSKLAAAARRILIRDEVQVIEEIAGKRLSYYDLAEEFNRRSAIQPLRGVEWSESTIRHALVRLGLR